MRSSSPLHTITGRLSPDVLPTSPSYSSFVRTSSEMFNDGYATTKAASRFFPAVFFALSSTRSLSETRLLSTLSNPETLRKSGFSR